MADFGIAYVLLSGGLDSTACVAFYRQQGFQVEGIFIDYGQAAVRPEAEAARAVAGFYGIRYWAFRWCGRGRKTDGFIVGRNAFLIAGAMMELPQTSGLLGMGIHAGTAYSDCTPAFAAAMQSLLDDYTHGTLRLGVPFLEWTKQGIWEFCRANGAPIHLTYSCERGEIPPCGRCLSCRDRKALNAGA